MKFNFFSRKPSLTPADDQKKVEEAAALIKAVQYDRAAALVEIGDLDEAEESLHESLTLDPSSQNAYAELEYIANLRRQIADSERN